MVARLLNATLMTPQLELYQLTRKVWYSPQCLRFRRANTHVLYSVVNDLYSKGGFVWMSMRRDEDEHSIEMQLPYLRKVCEG